MPQGHEYNKVEKAALEDLKALGYEIKEMEDDYFMDLRDNLYEVLLEDRLKESIKEINPWISEDNVQRAVNKLKKIKATDTMQINKKVHKKLVQHASVMQDRGNGRRNQTVKFIDYENPENNDFLAVSQFKVASSSENIIPDIVVFVNGIPLGVIECKSPTIADPQHKAIDQLLRYQNLRETDGSEGAEKLFWYNQFTVATSREIAASATYGASEQVYKEWKDPYPATEEGLKEVFDQDKIYSQDKLIYSLFKKDRLLEMIRFFTVFEETGQGINKIVTRYQQYRAVKKAMKEINRREKLDKQGGVIWHTQGSGKSFTMLFLSLMLKQKKDNPTLLIVTDRTTLDDQIKSTFEQAGLPQTKQAKSVEDLKEKLEGAAGQTITTLVHKFQEREDENFPVLSKDKDIYVMADEAHRTQYKKLANNMRTALPNAFYIGFSGTPIEKKKRNTKRTFGRYIDTYTIDKSIEDETTLPIFYQNRASELKTDGGSIEDISERIMEDKTEEEKKKIKQRYVREQDMVIAPQRIEKITLDIIKHFDKKIAEPFKGMIVTVNRKGAIEYKKKMDKLNAPESAVIISGEHNDSEEMKEYTPSEAQEKQLKKRFKDPNDDLKFVIVCEKLLTGFDVPIAQVMYLDKPLRGHNLLQAIARVNRPYKDKNYGLVVDYYGISEDLQKALKEFSDEDVGGAMTNIDDPDKVLAKLESAHRKAKSFFEGKELDNLEQCVEELEDEQTRLEFNKAFKKFAKMMDIVLPSSKANPYKKDLKRFGEIYQMAKNRYRDESMDLAGCGKKIRRLVREHIRSTDIEVINPEPVSITERGEFEDELGKLESDKAKASEMKHAVMHEINVRLEEDPSYFKSLKEKVEELVERYNQKRIEEKEIIKELEGVIENIRSRDEQAEEKGFSEETELSFYHSLDSALDLEQREVIDLTKELMKTIKNKVNVVDWKNKVNIQKKMRKDLKLKLIKNQKVKVEDEELDALVNKLIKLAREHF